jgi:hypothetical protein
MGGYEEKPVRSTSRGSITRLGSKHAHWLGRAKFSESHISGRTQASIRPGIRSTAEYPGFLEKIFLEDATPFGSVAY